MCVSRARGQSCVCQQGQGTVLCVPAQTGDSPVCLSRDRLRDRTVPCVSARTGQSHVCQQGQAEGQDSAACARGTGHVPSFGAVCSVHMCPVRSSLHTQGPGSLALSILFLQPPVTLPASLFLLSFDHSIKIKMEILQNMKSGSQADF